MSLNAVLIVFGTLLVVENQSLTYEAGPTESVRWSFFPRGSAFFIRPRPDERLNGLSRRFYVHSPDRQPELRAQLGPVNVTRPALVSPPPIPAYVRPSVHVANPRSVVTSSEPIVHYLCHVEVNSSFLSSASGTNADYCCLVRTELPNRNLNKAIFSVCEILRKSSYCHISETLPHDLWSPRNSYYDSLRPSEQQVRASFVLLPRHGNDINGCSKDPMSLPPGASFRPVQGSPMWLVEGQSSASTDKAVVREDKDVLLVVPRGRIKPGTPAIVTVKLVNNSNLVGFKLRISVNRAYFTTIKALSMSRREQRQGHWSVKMTLRRQRHEAEVTALLKDKYFLNRPKKEQTIFNVTFLIGQTSERKQNRVKVDWALLQTRYRDSQVRRSSAAHSFSTEINVGENRLINIVPVLKDTNLINTAILDGKRQEFPLRVFTINRYFRVSQMEPGRCTCHSNEGAIVQVDRSCEFVYLDGREKYGGWNISLIVKFSQYTAFIHVRVWVPERHMRLELSDPILNTVAKWRNLKVPSRRYSIDDDFRTEGRLSLFGRSKRPSVGVRKDREKLRRRRMCDRVYQMTQVKVYTRFVTHKGSGRFQRRRLYRQRYRYLINSSTWFDVTELVADQLGVDSSSWGPNEVPIADMKGTYLIGRSKGRAMVKLAVKGVVIGNTTFHVNHHKVRVTDLQVQPITALRSFVKPDKNPRLSEVTLVPLNNVNASSTDAYLHMRLFFSDGSVVSLADRHLSDLPLTWESKTPPALRVQPSSSRLWPVFRTTVAGRAQHLSLWLQGPRTCRSRTKFRSVGPRTEVVIGGPQVPRKPTPPRRRPKPPPPDPPIVPKIDPEREWRRRMKEMEKKKQEAEKKKKETPREKVVYEIKDRNLTDKQDKAPPVFAPQKPPSTPAPAPALFPHTVTPAVHTPVSPRDGPQEDEPGRGRRLRPLEGDPVDKQALQLSPRGAVTEEQEAVSPTPLEIGMYVLLCIFCVAATVFAVNCGLMLARYQRRRMCRRTEAGKEGPCLSPVYEHGNLVGTREARNWVWLRPPGSGGSSEDKRPLSMASSHLPSHSAQNASLPRSSVSATGVSASSAAVRQERQSIAGLASLTHAAVQPPRHYQGDECSIRILNNPLPLHLDSKARPAVASPSSTRSAPPPSFPPPPPPPSQPPAPPQRTTSCRGTARAASHNGSGGSSVASTMRGWERHLRALPVEQRFAYFNNMKESVA